MPHLQAALNGSRAPTEHPAIPRTPAELAREAGAAAEAGAELVHVHAYENGVETLAAGACAAVLLAIRAACPSLPISLTTSADIESDPERRLELVGSWIELPELVTANQGEAGIAELCTLLLERGVGIEAGLLSIADAEAFVGSGLPERCTRVLVEPLGDDRDGALAEAAAIEDVLDRAGVGLEQVHHGEGIASWAVSERGLARGHGMRTGLEDMTVLPDGSPAADNAELVRAAVELIARSAR